MITYRAVPYKRVMGQQAPAAAPAPALAPVPASSPLINLIGWSVLGLVTGGVTGYAVGKGLGKRNTPMQDAIIGGVAGAAATLVAKIL